MDIPHEPAAPDEPDKPEVWMVYLPEWLVFYTSTLCGEPARTECLSWYTEHYRGKIREQDWRIVTPLAPGDSNSPALYTGRWRLMLCVPNLRGIRADKTAAEDQAAQLGPSAQVVARFSAEERTLLRYGKSLIHE